MYLVDTNIVSVLDGRYRSPAVPLLDWLRRNSAHLHVSVITLMELEAGVLKLERSGPTRRATELRAFINAIGDSLGSRPLPVTRDVASAAARLAERALPAQPETSDLLIAATAQVHGLTVLTRNLRHFIPTGVACHDPLASLPPDG